MRFLNKIFKKGDENFKMENSLPYFFTLKIDDLIVGYLELSSGKWFFKYSNEFKDQTKYRRLTGFSDINKEYSSEELWPFFKIRIPGLKQPMIREIIEKEKLDSRNEALLLKRFGNQIMTNPYILEASQ